MILSILLLSVGISIVCDSEVVSPSVAMLRLDDLYGMLFLIAIIRPPPPVLLTSFRLGAVFPNDCEAGDFRSLVEDGEFGLLYQRDVDFVLPHEFFEFM